MTGCITTQEKANAGWLSDELYDSTEQQIVENIIRFSEDQSSEPRHTTTNKITPEVDVAVTPQITSAVGANIQTTTGQTIGATSSSTGSLQATNAPWTFQVSGSATWKQSAEMVPVTDRDKLRKLRSIYLYVVTGVSNEVVNRTVDGNKRSEPGPVVFLSVINKAEDSKGESDSQPCLLDEHNSKPGTECALKISNPANANGAHWPESSIDCGGNYDRIGEYDNRLLCGLHEMRKYTGGNGETFHAMAGLTRFHDIENAVNEVLSAPKQPSQPQPQSIICQMPQPKK